MKSLIITVAGTATRFNKDTEEDTLKCLYYLESFEYSLLYQILHKADDFDEFIIVGGYLFDVLESFIDRELTEYRDKIKLIYNPEYKTFGSGYSLVCGINALSKDSSEVVFVEGDLYYSKEDFDFISSCPNNLLSVNHELISAKKSVVAYSDLKGKIHYLYDTSHSYLEIKEPFLSIYNSGQIWKFVDIARLREAVASLNQLQLEGTNLEIIQKYFGQLSSEEYVIRDLSVWYNCNTVSDYNIVYTLLKK